MFKLSRKKSVQNLDPVIGKGSYFGFIEAPPNDTASHRVLNVFYLYPERKTILNLGQAELRPDFEIPLRETAVLEQKPIPEDDSFEVYQINHGSPYIPLTEITFDEEGNYYDLAKTPTEIAVYRYKIDRQLADKMIREQANP